MTKESRGGDVCILVLHACNTDGESLDSFTQISSNTVEDRKIFDALEGDGLKLGEWITIPDPYQEDWPFHKRYPGVPCPPETDELEPW